MKCGGKIFFGSLVICILSFFYFKLIPYSQVSNLIGYIFLEIFLGCNFYIGYKYKLNKKEAVMVGILGSSFGIFLLFFAAYTYYIMREFYWGIWMVKFYLFPTMSFINDFFVDITLAYVVFLIGFNNRFLFFIHFTPVKFSSFQGFDQKFRCGKICCQRNIVFITKSYNTVNIRLM